jgi:hypothetical protein
MQHDTPKARARVRAWAQTGVLAQDRAAASEVHGGSCVQVSPASTLLLHDNFARCVHHSHSER